MDSNALVYRQLVHLVDVNRQTTRSVQTTGTVGASEVLGLLMR